MKNKNILRPFVGVNDIFFGSKRNVLREKIEGNYKEIKRNEFAENTTDFYEKLGFFIEYSKDNICEAMEFTSESNLFHNGQDLFLLEFPSLERKYNEQSLNIEVEDEIGVTYYDLGFGVACEYGTDKIESIIVFSRVISYHTH